MDFFDKLGEAAKNAGNKADGLIEIGKLNAKIASGKSSISDMKAALGELCYNKYSEGTTFDDDVGAQCTKIKAAYDDIASIEAQIADIKRKAAEAEKAKAAPKQPPKCEKCGKELPEGAKFCFECGTPVKQPEPEPVQESEPTAAPEPSAPQPVICSQCGAKIDPGMRFCPECGKPVPESAPDQPKAEAQPVPEQAAAQPAFCAQCGAKLDADAVFCPECGAKRI